VSYKDIGFAVLSVLLWASNILAQKTVAQELSPFLLAFLRSGSLLPLLFFFPKPPSQKWRYMLAGTFWCSFNFIFLNLGWKMGVGVAVSSFIIQTNVFFSILQCFVLLKERPNSHQIFGMMVAAVGVSLLANAQDVMANPNWLAGIGIMLMASLSWGTGYALLKKFQIGSTMADITWLSSYSAILLLLLTLVMDGPGDIYGQLLALSPEGWGCIVFAVVASTIVASRLWLYLSQKYTAGQVMPYMLLIPIFALIIGQVAIGEVLSSSQVKAGSLILFGVFISQVMPYFKKRQQSKAME
jgi:O-acetylserine/cysteine efflux transporter